MAVVKCNPGICGFITEIETVSEDGMNATMTVTSDCEHIKALAEAVPSVNGYEECFAKYGEGKIAKAATEHCQHGACPVPTAMLKSVEVVCSLALPKEFGATIEK